MAKRKAKMHLFIRDSKGQKTAHPMYTKMTKGAAATLATWARRDYRYANDALVTIPNHEGCYPCESLVTWRDDIIQRCFFDNGNAVEGVGTA